MSTNTDSNHILHTIEREITKSQLLNSCLVVLFFLSVKIIISLSASLYRGLRFFLFDDLCKDFTNAEGDLLRIGSYPNGWNPVAETEMLPIGAILKVNAFGQDIVLMRDLNGKVHAVDPYCPHNGAHLGFGEVVNIRGEDCIRCPFHEWSFRAEDGVCIDVPYAKDRKAPNGSAIKVWKCVEVNNVIFVWHHNRGYEPDWHPETITSIDSGALKYCGRIEFFINSDIYLVTENTSDLAHLPIVHREPSFFFEVIGKLFGHGKIWVEQTFENFSWEPMKFSNKHKAIAEYTVKHRLFGFELGNASIRTIQSGPYLVTVQLEIKFLGLTSKREMIALYSPIHANKVKFVTRMYAKKGFLSWLGGRIALVILFFNLHGDCNIWQNMIHLKNQIYLKEEKGMLDFRRWYKQFYDGMNCETHVGDGLK